MQLWEWFEEHPDGYGYFRATYHDWLAKSKYKTALRNWPARASAIRSRWFTRAIIRNRTRRWRLMRVPQRAAAIASRMGRKRKRKKSEFRIQNLEEESGRDGSLWL
jgi:hypothetical protein